MRSRMQVGLMVVTGSLAGAASGQTFAEYFLDGENMTGGRTTDNAEAGDVIRMSLRVRHDSLSFAGGKVDISYGGVDDGDITLTEDEFSFPFDPWVIGREPLFRIIASDGPADATRPHNEDIIALGGEISDVNSDFFDFASTPPGLGGLGAAFPLASGEAIFVFDYVYNGGENTWDAKTNGEARLWRDGNDVNGAVVEARNGDTFIIGIIPAPATIAPLAMLGAIRFRRRR